MKKRILSVEALESRRVFAAATAPALDWESVIVSLNENVGNPRAVGEGSVKQHGGQLGHIYQNSIKGFSAQLPAAAIAALAKNPQVKLIEPDLRMQGYGQVKPTGIDRIDADNSVTARIDGIDGSVSDGQRVNVNIAIIDSGVDPAHPDLNVAGGTRFYTINSGPVRSRGSFNDGNFNDDNGHGSHVAGIAAAIDNNIGTVGVAPGARLWGIKVLDANNAGYVSDIIAGIDWVTATRADANLYNDIDVANMSLGGQGSSIAYHNAIKASVNAGIVYVVAAGNAYRDILGSDFAFGTSDDTIPAAYPEVATISAFADTDGVPGNLGSLTQYVDPAVGRYEDDTFADFSNFSNSQSNGSSYYHSNNKVASPGLGIDLMMPGVDIYSTYKNGGYAMMSGTSMAAPHAAGLAALYIAQHGRANEATGVYRIRQALIDGGKGWKSPEGLHFDNPSYISDSPDNFIENLGWAGSAGPMDRAPTINITSPANLAVVSEDVLLTAAAADDYGVTKVEFLADDNVIHTDVDGADGWSATWSTVGLLEGTHVIKAIATDTSGQTASHIVNITVDNVDDPPMVSIITPVNNATVSGTIVVSANVVDDRGVASVDFFAGNELIGTDTNGANGWAVSWDTVATADGPIQLVAVATDSIYSIRTSDFWVTVSNPPQPSSMHVADLDASSTVQAKTWTATVTVTVQDSAGNRVVGASVSGSWSGGVTGSSKLQTDSRGMVTFIKSKILKNAGAVQFAVTDILGTLIYNRVANFDPETDSNGTSIVVKNPFSTSASSGSEPRDGGDVVPSTSTSKSAKPAAISAFTADVVFTPKLSELQQADKRPSEAGTAVDAALVTLLAQQ